jgi:hypothetical protein
MPPADRFDGLSNRGGFLEQGTEIRGGEELLPDLLGDALRRLDHPFRLLLGHLEGAEPDSGRQATELELVGIQLLDRAPFLLKEGVVDSLRF